MPVFLRFDVIPVVFFHRIRTAPCSLPFSCRGSSHAACIRKIRLCPSPLAGNSDTKLGRKGVTGFFCTSILRISCPRVCQPFAHYIQYPLKVIASQSFVITAALSFIVTSVLYALGIPSQLQASFPSLSGGRCLSAPATGCTVSAVQSKPPAVILPKTPVSLL